MGEWKFRQYGKDEMRSNPIQEEFFTTNEVGSISNAIVREGIQNALDEWIKDDGNIVRIRIFLSGEKYKLSKTEFDPLLQGLYPHLLESSSGLRNLPEFEAGMKYLVFEDFNTKGLEGDTEEADADDNTKPHNFFWFWRNVGISGKSDEKLGRWGLGKTVFPASSRINTFWGITVRHSEPSVKLLMGQSILMSHRVNGDPKYGYVPYGFYGNFNDSNSSFASPTTNPELLAFFESKFRLNRGSSSGLSIISPFVTEEITQEGLVYSVVEQYFFPILQGKLEVCVQHEDHSILLNDKTIRTIISSVDFTKLDDEKLRIKNNEAFQRLFDLSAWVCSLNSDSYIKLKEPNVSNVPQWRASLFESIDFAELASKFENGERLAFLVPLKSHPKNDDGSIRWFKCFLEKDTSLVRPENHYIRNGITITGINSLSSPGVRGIALIEDEHLVKMIGDAENPAHTEIQKDSRNFKDKYVDGDKCLSFLSRALQEIFLRLQKPAEGLEKDILKDFFYVPLTEKEHEAVVPDDDSDDGTNNPDLPDIPRGERTITKVIKTEGGFKVLKSADIADIKGLSVEVKLGYLIARGNPIKKYDRLDFELDKHPINTVAKGVQITRQQLNELCFEVQSADFEVELNGFDSNRDLVVKVNELKLQ